MQLTYGLAWLLTGGGMLIQHNMTSRTGHVDLPPEATMGAAGEAWVSSLGAYRDARKTEEERDAALATALSLEAPGHHAASPSGRYDATADRGHHAAASGGVGIGMHAPNGGAPMHLRNGSMHPLDLRSLQRHQSNRRATTILLWALCLAHLGLFLGAVSLNDWTLVSMEDNPLLGPGLDALRTIGATSTQEIVYGQQYWRLLVSPFLGAGALHVWANTTTLLSIGLFLSWPLTWWVIGLMYLVCGIASVAVSANVATGFVTAAGSGPAFGFMGAAAVVLALCHKRLKCALLSWGLLAFALAVNCFIGATPFVDNSANTTGFVAGALICAGVLCANWMPSCVHAEALARAMSVGLIALALAMPVIAVIGLNAGMPIGGCCDAWVCAPSSWWDCSASQVHPGGCTFTTASGGLVSITCPNGDVLSIAASGLGGGSSQRQAVCGEVCG
ncbi:hypothetical protein FOA52_016232 [Chlamydomonas sp. UWO 241]|nr:hypothetical protein FOA52_016232 [Chlamydomonas sp. UWO 241]